MKIIRCEAGHFYDSEKYPWCPYCVIHPMSHTDPAKKEQQPDKPVAVVYGGPPLPNKND